MSTNLSLGTRVQSDREIVIPFRQRWYDVVFVFFFLINVCFVTYIIDIEQIIVSNPYHFNPPAWPPMFFIRMVHHYGALYDPDLMARAAWWKATIWIDVLGFGPFYVLATYAFVRGRNWIRIPAIIYSSVMLTNLTVIMFEEMGGATPTPHPLVVLGVYSPYILIPLALLVRMIPTDNPFKRRV
ncbi:EXPERA domain-containing protein [Alicyclobacillus sp. ALC3]|uniref:EXPERA domain-containing protein n=1 Tax=Alicyclobacillus sp. ALC3 TaxID=2796143 RepID=UPI0023781B7A|nr:emopamil-binding family protein [Alicyclobacillus sp. ALC3]WDL98791.1 DUF2781 domain-containing protein [Alicyclobacillus sp. ALC3]